MPTEEIDIDDNGKKVKGVITHKSGKIKVSVG